MNSDAPAVQVDSGDCGMTFDVALFMLVSASAVVAIAVAVPRLVKVVLTHRSNIAAPVPIVMAGAAAFNDRAILHHHAAGVKNEKHPMVAPYPYARHSATTSDRPF